MWVCSKSSFRAIPPVGHVQICRVVDADVSIGHGQRGIPITDKVGPTLGMYGDVPKNLLLGMLKMRSSLRIREMGIPYKAEISLRAMCEAHAQITGVCVRK